MAQEPRPEVFMVSLDNPDRKWRGTDYFGEVLTKWVQDNTCDYCPGMGKHNSWCEARPPETEEDDNG